MKRKTLASLALAGLVLAGSIMPAQAAVNVVPDGHEPATEHTEATTTEDVCMWQTADANGDEAQCDVYAKVGSSFTVTIPKKITLDGSTRTGSYTVSCKGDIAGTEYVSVTPDASFDMIQTGKDNVTATITQEKLNFRGYNYYNGVDDTLPEKSVKMGNNAGTVASEKLEGSIDAQGLTAGAWNGTFNFAIALEQD